SSCAALSGQGGTLSEQVTILSGGTLTYTLKGLVPVSTQGALSSSAAVIAPAGAQNSGGSSKSVSRVTQVGDVLRRVYLPIRPFAAPLSSPGEIGVSGRRTPKAELCEHALWVGAATWRAAVPRLRPLCRKMSRTDATSPLDESPPALPTAPEYNHFQPYVAL